LLRDYDSVCNDFGSTIGNWQSGKNPGCSVEAKKFCKFCVAGATEISNWEIDVTCGSWFHNRCGNVKAQVVDGEKWIYDKCRSERFRLLE